jgi:hypothetical protein
MSAKSSATSLNDGTPAARWSSPLGGALARSTRLFRGAVARLMRRAITSAVVERSPSGLIHRRDKMPTEVGTERTAGLGTSGSAA